jgi:predicted RNA binding protein YcfA (HicA-like mRNA interferase family)
MASPVRFAKVRKQLEAAGYRLVRVSGSHHIFERPGSPIVSIPVHGNKVKPHYATQVEKIIAAEEEAGEAARREPRGRAFPGGTLGTSRGDEEAGEGEGGHTEGE